MQTYVNKKRRRIIGLAMAGTGVVTIPNIWRRPVVESVVLPAHAQTSQGTVDCTEVLTASDIFDAVSCGNFTPTFNTIQVNDDDGCRRLQVEFSTAAEPTPTPSSHQIVIFMPTYNAGDSTLSISAAHPALSPDASATRNGVTDEDCSNTDPGTLSTVNPSPVIAITTSSGATANVSLTLDFNDSLVASVTSIAIV